MGNTPSTTGRKRSRPAKKQTDDDSPPAAKQVRKDKRQKESDNDKDVTCLTPSAQKSGSGALKWKPAGGPAKLTQSVGHPTPSTSKSQSSRERKDKTKQKKQDSFVVATTGPRGQKDDSDEYYAIESVLKKWVGASDRRLKDSFYLIHFVGQPKPPLRSADESLWLHPSQMLDCQQLMDECDGREMKPKSSSGSRKPGYYYVDEDSDEEPSNGVEVGEQRTAVEEVVVNGRSLRKRHREESGENRNQALAVIAKEGRKQRRDVEKIEPVIGFDRGLEAEKIIGSTYYQQQLLYAIKWRASDTVDYVVSTLCHDKSPDLVIDYLVSKLRNVPKISSSELSFT